jgi:hypothetical protein
MDLRRLPAPARGQQEDPVPAVPDQHVVKWSDTSGHRVKAVKCHNEVSDDNRYEKAAGTNTHSMRRYPEGLS